MNKLMKSLMLNLFFMTFCSALAAEHPMELFARALEKQPDLTLVPRKDKWKSVKQVYGNEQITVEFPAKAEKSTHGSLSCFEAEYKDVTYLFGHFKPSDYLDVNKVAVEIQDVFEDLTKNSNDAQLVSLNNGKWQSHDLTDVVVRLGSKSARFRCIVTKENGYVLMTSHAESLKHKHEHFLETFKIKARSKF